MIANRDYYRHTDANTNTNTDPEDTCAFCDGRGFRRQRQFDPASSGWICETCPVCGGASETGVFVVQVVTARFRHELTYHTKSLPAAIRRAELRSQALSRAGGLCLGSRVLSVNVVYKSTQTRRGDEIVASVRMVVGEPVAA